MIETLSLLAVLAWLFAARHDLTLASPLPDPRRRESSRPSRSGYAVLFGAKVGAAAPTGGEGRGSPGEMRPNVSSYRAEYASYLVVGGGLESRGDRVQRRGPVSARAGALARAPRRFPRRRAGRAARQPASRRGEPRVPARGHAPRRGGAATSRVVESTRIFFKFNTIFVGVDDGALIVFARDVIVVVSSAAYDGGRAAARAVSRSRCRSRR